MKAIEVSDIYRAASGESFARCRFYADSAIWRDHMPLFLPDAPAPLGVDVCPAVMISRLGHTIAPKFAMRYVGAVGAVALLRCSDPDFDAMLPVIDAAVTTGMWIPLDALPEQIELTSACGEDTRTILFSFDSLDFSSYLEKISRRTTVKTGDIIIFRSFAASFAPSPNQHVTATVAGRPSLNIKIK